MRRVAAPSLLLLAAASLALPVTARAQTSASYKLQEYAFNNGGVPANGSFASSTSYRIKLEAIGDAVATTGLSSVSNHMDGGFVGDYPPPGEVKGDVFTNKTTLAWSPEKSIGTYDVYRASISTLPGLTYGACLQSGITTETATDTVTPTVGQGYFYLITARNRLGEIGTKGFATSGTERANAAPCP